MTIANGEYFVRESQKEVTTLLKHLDEEAAKLDKYTRSERNVILWCAFVIRRDLRFLMKAQITGGATLVAPPEEGGGQVG